MVAQWAGEQVYYDDPQGSRLGSGVLSFISTLLKWLCDINLKRKKLAASLCLKVVVAQWAEENLVAHDAQGSRLSGGEPYFIRLCEFKLEDKSRNKRSK